MKTNKEQQLGYTSNELTIIQKVALEGEVSMCYEVAIHRADQELNTYVLCCSISPEYLSVYREAMLEYIDEETFNKCYRYAVQEMFPVSLFINKVISDIKGYIGNPDCQTKDKMPKVPKAILKSKFVGYIRVMAEFIPSICRELIEAIIADDTGKLDFLKDVAFSLSLELYGKNDTVTSYIGLIKLVQTPLLETATIPFMSETHSLESKQRDTEEPHTKKSDFSNAIQSVLNSLIGEEKSVSKKYYVIKIDKSTKLEVMKKAFDSQSEAIDYCKGIERDYKELLDRYDFKIVGE